ncbi:MAG: exosortase/archaeosortase family protein [Methylacidiphilales bacterium]|nr:exosortase/archaeosortase family protein [Candidatus Methylacidiphilales bacterium]
MFLLLPGIYWLTLWWDIHIDWATNAQYAFGWFVPVAAAGLFLQRWLLRPIPDAPHGTCRALIQAGIVILVLLHLPLRFVGEANAEWRMLFWVREIQCIFLSLGCLALAGGWRWARHFAFPILFSATAIPWPSGFEGQVVQWLTRLGAAATVEGLFWIGIPAVQLGNTIQVSNGIVGLNTACSGIRSLQVCIMIAFLAGEFWNLRRAQSCWAVVFGGLAALFFNALRMFALTWIEAANGSDAFQRWHDPLGWIEMGTCMASVVLFAGWMRNKAPQISEAARNPARHDDCRVSPCSTPGWLLIFSIVVWLLAAVGTAQWYAAHEQNETKTPQWNVIAPSRSDPDFAGWFRVEIPEESRALLRTNDGIALQWASPGGLVWHVSYLQWPAARSSAAAAAAHHPDICLPAVGYQLICEAPFIDLTVKHIPLRFHHYLFKGKLHPVHVFYAHRAQDASLYGDLDNFNPPINSRFKAAFAGRRSVAQAVLQVILTGAPSDEIAIESLKKVVGKLVHTTEDASGERL